MKTLTIQIFYLSLLISQVFAQQPNYFPINLGNEYQFIGRRTLEYIYGRIERDTIYSNGNQYYSLPYGIFEFGDTRVDSNGNILSISKPFFGGEPDEQLLFKADAVLNEIWPVAWNFGPVIDTGYARCIYDDSLYVFDVKRRVKGTLIFDESYHYYYFWLAEEIGLIRTQYDDGSGLDLNYAKIDGKIYGTLVSIDNEPILIPEEYSVSQNFPNPFNGNTIIQVSLPTQSTKESVKFAVYNILGSKVYEQNYNASKFLTIRFNSDEINLSSGTYFYSVSTGSRSITKKFLLLK